MFYEIFMGVKWRSCIEYERRKLDYGYQTEKQVV